MAVPGSKVVADVWQAPQAYENRALMRRWEFERAMAWTRWGAIPITLLLIPLFPSVHVSTVLVFAVLVGLGNGWLTMCFAGPHDPGRRQSVHWTATGLDWSIAAGSMTLFGPELARLAPGLLLLLVLTTAIRYGHVGLLIAAILATVMVLSQSLLIELIQGIQAASSVRSERLGWTLLVLTTACVAGGLVRAIEHYERSDEEQWSRYGNVLPRFQFGITEREWQVLQLIAREDRTYRQIAGELHVSPETIKTHVRNLGDKLGASGRRRVVVAARQRGLFPYDDTY